MAEMTEKKGEMEREIKRFRHHGSVHSKRNHWLVEDGKSRATAPIASVVSLCVCRKGEEVAESEAEVAEEVATIEAEEEAGVVGEKCGRERGGDG